MQEEIYQIGGKPSKLPHARMAFSLDGFVAHRDETRIQADCKNDKHAFPLYVPETRKQGVAMYTVCSERISVLINSGRSPEKNDDCLIPTSDPECVLTILEESDHPFSMLKMSSEYLYMDRRLDGCWIGPIIATSWLEILLQSISDRWQHLVDLAIVHNRMLVSVMIHSDLIFPREVYNGKSESVPFVPAQDNAC